MYYRRIIKDEAIGISATNAAIVQSMHGLFMPRYGSSPFEKKIEDVVSCLAGRNAIAYNPTNNTVVFTRGIVEIRDRLSINVTSLGYFLMWLNELKISRPSLFANIQVAQRPKDL